MKIDHRRERTSNIILFFTARTHQCTKTKLMHLLYLLDFGHFKLTGRSVTDNAYNALPTGPAPADLCGMLHRLPNTPSFLDDLIDDADTTAAHTVLLAKREMVDDYLTPRQLGLMTTLVDTYGAGDALQLAVCATGTPWQKVYREGLGVYGAIPYDLALDGLAQRDVIRELAREHQQHVAAAQRAK